MIANSSATELKQALYQLLDEGWHLFPLCWFDDQKQCICGHKDKDGKPQPHTENNIGKAPILTHGLNDATTTHQGINEFMRLYPHCNWGGWFPGMLALDVDPKHNGYESLEKLETKNGKLPKTRTHQSGSGGLHIIYKQPQGYDIGNTVKLAGYEGIDRRGNGGYIVMPPSSHVSGGCYKVIDDSPILEAPKEVLDLQGEVKEHSQAGPIPADIPSGMRNQTLVSLGGSMRRRGLAAPTIEAALREVNRAQCKPPLSDDEVHSIAESVGRYEPGGGNGNGHKNSDGTVDSFITVDKKGNAVLDITKLTVAIMGKTTFAFMRDNDTGFYYENGVYKENAERLVAATCQRLVGITPILTEHKINEIIGHIRRSCYHDRKEFNPDPNIINVKNGLLNVLTCTLAPHTPDYLSNVQNPVEYNPAADCPAIKQFLAEIHEKEDISTMQELFGYLLLRDNRIQKAVLSVGGGENGKSTEQRVIQAFLGPENCAHKSWQQLENDRFASSGLEGKLVNLFADLPSNGVDTTTTFKMLTGGDAIDAERKFKDSYSFLSFAKLIFSTNRPPKVSNEDSYAFWRRWIIMEYPRQFTDKDKKPNILQELTTPEELSGLLNYALDGLKRLLAVGKFSYNKSVDEVTEYYMQAADPVYAFAASSECDIRGDVVVLKDAFYDAFKEYCKKNKMPILAPNSFARSLVNQVGFHVRATKNKRQRRKNAGMAGYHIGKP